MATVAADDARALARTQASTGLRADTADRLPSLDGLRGLAVLIVLGSHLSNSALLPQPGLSGTGKSGVYLFFVLSAFLLTLPLLSRPPRALADARLWANYVLRRVLRIWPLYLVVLASGWLLTSSGVAWHYAIDTPAFLRHLALVDGQSVLWSIPVEFTFYAWLPPLAVALALLPRATPAFAIALIGVALMFGASWIWPYALLEDDITRLGPYVPAFLGGAFAAALHARLGPPSHARLWAAPGLLAALAFVATIPSVWSTLAGEPFRANLNHAWLAFFGLLWSALLLAVLRGPDWLRAPFEMPALRGIGLVSYSLYLWHMPVLDAFRGAGWPGGLLPATVVVAAALGIAWLSYRLVERPLHDVRWPRRRDARS